ncbi:MAG: hypothetical protein AB7S26_18040 [Sandaracinaceae bacterium]
MAKRAIVLTYGEEESRFGFSRVDRGKLYGRKERAILDENGDRCVPAFLTPDGAALVPPGGTAHVYVNEAFDHVPRSELVAVDADGNEIEAIASTLGTPQALSPTRPQRILDHTIASVYQLDPETLGDELAKALEDGELFEAGYAYSQTYRADVLFLLKNEEGVFGLVGRPTGFDFLERDAPPPLELGDEDEDELDEDLDFSML